MTHVAYWNTKLYSDLEVSRSGSHLRPDFISETLLVFFFPPFSMTGYEEIQEIFMIDFMHPELNKK